MFENHRNHIHIQRTLLRNCRLVHLRWDWGPVDNSPPGLSGWLSHIVGEVRWDVREISKCEVSEVGREDLSALFNMSFFNFWSERQNDWAKAVEALSWLPVFLKFLNKDLSYTEQITIEEFYRCFENHQQLIITDIISILVKILEFIFKVFSRFILTY